MFCDASQWAYGSVAYLRTEADKGRFEVALIAARSQVAQKKQQTILHLELCTALTGAQLAIMLMNDLSLTLRQVTLWTDSTTVLTWLTSDTCQYKIFVGTRVAEIQKLTNDKPCRYVGLDSNPVDDVTWGKKLADLGPQSGWDPSPSMDHPTSGSRPLQSTLQ